MKNTVKKLTSLILVLAIGLSFRIPMSANAAATTFRFHFINVGEGDAIIIESSDGHYMLVDTGYYVEGKGDRTQNLVEFIKNKGIETFDYVVITHYDPDHAGGLQRLFGKNKVIDKNITVKNYVVRGYNNTTYNLIAQQGRLADFKTCYDKFNEIKGITTVLKPSQGTTYNFQGATMTFLNPTKTNFTSDTINDLDHLAGTVNLESLVFRFSFNLGGKTNSVLFTGDYWDFSKLLNDKNQLECDILKSSHHGRTGSNTKAILAKVNPSAIAICGPDRYICDTSETCQFGCNVNNGFNEDAKKYVDTNNIKVYATCKNNLKRFYLRFNSAGLIEYGEYK